MVGWIFDFFRNLFEEKPGPEEDPRPEGHEVSEKEEPAALEPVPEEDPEIPPPNIEVSEPEVEEPEPEEPPSLIVGAWTGRASLANPERDIQFCLKTGIRRLDVIVNDHSAARKPRDFSTFSIKKITRLVELAQANNIDVHFMSWCMPHEAYIDQAAEKLIPLCKDLNITSLQWDAEEPWTKAHEAMKYSKAAKRLADAFKDLSCPMGVNGIGYTPQSKFGPLAEVCDYVVPQIYVTGTNSLSPTKSVPKFVRRYRKLFGEDKKVVVGLAAYRQKGFKKHTAESAMGACFAGAEATEGVDEVIYWSLGSIRKSTKITNIVRSLAEPDTPVSGNIA